MTTLARRPSTDRPTTDIREQWADIDRQTYDARITLDHSEGSPRPHGQVELPTAGATPGRDQSVQQPECGISDLVDTEPPSTAPTDDLAWNPLRDLDEAHPLQLQSQVQGLLHERVAARRRLIIDALWNDTQDTALRHRARQMGWCGSRPAIRSSATGPRPALARCRDRMCPLCAKLRGIQASHRTAAAILRFNSPRFITLTLAHSDTPLRDQLVRLVECFGKLRQDKIWKRSVAGGITGIEVTYRTATNRWHVHAHIIVTGKYLPQPQLKAAWLRATGDSHIVDIRIVADRQQAAKYISRYVSKPIDAETWPESRLREYAHAMKGRRLLQPFGVAMAKHLDDDHDDATEPGTEHVCHADKLCQASDAGHQPAKSAVEILARTSPSMAVILLRPWARDSKPETPSSAEISWAMEVARITGVTQAADLATAYAALPPPPDPGESPCP